MYGSPIARPALPPLTAETPYIVVIDGRPWLSSLGIADAMHQPHTELVAQITRLDVGPDWFAEHFRESRTGRGVRAPGLWISQEGFWLLSLVLPRDQRSRWRDTLREAFRAALALSARPLPDIGQVDAIAEAHFPPRFLPRWLRRLFARRPPCKA